MWFWLVFGLGIFVGALVILGIEAILALAIVNRLTSSKNLRTHQTCDLDHNQSLDFNLTKQGVVWVLESSKVPKDWLDNNGKARKKEFFEVSPARKPAKMSGETLILTESDGSKTIVKLKGVSVEAVSASNLASRKWAKRFPIKLESKVSSIYKGSKTLYLFLETSWEKESWCKALRLTSSEDKSKLVWSLKLQKEFRSYLTSLNSGYPSFMKPSSGFYGSELQDKSQKNDGSTSKVQKLWKKLAKKASSKVGGDNNRDIRSTGFHSFPSYKDSALMRQSVEDNGDATSPRLTYSGSQSQASAISDLETDERLGVDEGTLCWNLLLSRLFFDSKQNPEMKKSFQARIQRTLANMRTPNYVGEIICTDVDLGNIPPHIHGMRVRPMDTNEVWAFDVDLEYSGGAVLGIETRLEVRELDPEKNMVASNSESSALVDVSSELLEGMESFGKHLNHPEGTIAATENKDESDPKQGSKSGPAPSTVKSRWKSVVNSIAIQVSQVPISLAIRVSSLRGTLRVHIKPPPSDQLWFGFTSMPHIELNLDSAVGDHKITNGQIAMFLINRLKGAIHETLVLPNCESAGISFMLAEKNDWVPRNVAPFIWIRHETMNDSTNSSNDALDDQPCKEKRKTESDKGSSNGNSHSNERKQKDDEGFQSIDETLEAMITPSSSTAPSDLKELKTPLLGNNGEVNPREAPESTSRSLILPDKQSIVIEEDDKPKRMGRRARMFDLGKKMGDKLEEKRRSIEEKSKQIVEKMRGPQ